MEQFMARRDIALALLVVALFCLAHSWVAVLDKTQPNKHEAVVAVQAAMVGIKNGESPDTVGQRYQGSLLHYINHVYYITDNLTLQGGGQHGGREK